MDLILDRNDYGPYGIFGNLLTVQGGLIFVTLEHSYITADASYYAKIPLGVWTCVRGSHRLDGMLKDFETFEIQGVPGRSGLLFHWGNYNVDSQGCILLGDKIEQDGAEKFITHSKISFESFMAIQAGIDHFQLTVKSTQG